MIAKVVVKSGKPTPNGREMKMQLRMGAEGTGRIIQEIIYWPWSRQSVDAATEIMRSAAKFAGVNIIW